MPSRKQRALAMGSGEMPEVLHGDAMRSLFALIALFSLSHCSTSTPHPSSGRHAPIDGSRGATPPQHPFTAANGGATMHGDAGSSDTSPFAGPGPSPRHLAFFPHSAACPTIVAGADQMPIALCTAWLDRVPSVRLLDPKSGSTLAELRLTKGALLGGVYAYLDANDRLVLVDGADNLLRIAHGQDTIGRWRLTIEESIALRSVLQSNCDQPPCDSVVALVPDWNGRVTFASQHGLVGMVDPDSHAVRTLALPREERIDNSISAAPEGVAIATSHALYVVAADSSGTPAIRWRQVYDRGPARKPGQLSWGTGATPTFFGPSTGADYVTITDNATPLTNLLVYRVSSGELVCQVPILTPSSSGTELSPIGYDRSVYVASTYGYPYPQLPEGAGPSQPISAPFVGGMQRFDVRDDESGCDEVWSNQVKSAAVPRLSLGDGLLYTVERKGLVNPGQFYDAVAIDPESGDVIGRTRLGFGLLYDPLQMVGTLTKDGTNYQGTMGGIVRIRR